MNDILNVLTPTGARPEAFKKCVEYMKAQTYTGPVRWIIVDDGPEAMEVPEIKDWLIIHIRPEPLWEPGQNTHARNLKEGLLYVDGPLVIVEDDDQYAPWWLAQCKKWLETHSLVGEAPSLYRHVDGQEKWMNNTQHASLCATAMKGNVIKEFKRTLSHRRAIDIKLWEKCRHMAKIYPHNGGVIGIKGYPGRPGIGVGHKPEKY